MFAVNGVAKDWIWLIYLHTNQYLLTVKLQKEQILTDANVEQTTFSQKVHSSNFKRIIQYLFCGSPSYSYLCNVGFGGDEVDEAWHCILWIQHTFIHVDVQYHRTILYLSLGYTQRLLHRIYTENQSINHAAGDVPCQFKIMNRRYGQHSWLGRKWKFVEIRFEAAFKTR